MAKKGGQQAAPPGGDHHPEAERVYKIIKAHEAVNGKASPPEYPKDGGGGFIIRFTMEVALPSHARSKGESATGVRFEEPINFLFSPEYPYRAPIISLRSDFNQELPHINPVPGLVNPCIYYGVLDELLHQEGDGLSRILNQLSEWLKRAASNQLIDTSQGWEPIRRDYTKGWIVFDLSACRRQIGDLAGAKVFKCLLSKDLSDKDEYIVSGIKLEKPIGISVAFLDELFKIENSPFGPLMRSIAVFAWPNKFDDGTVKIVGKYLPETVINLGQLYDRADAYGCSQALKSVLADLSWAWQKLSWKKNHPIFIVLAARRPFNLIGDGSPLELIPYMLLCRMESQDTSFGKGGLSLSNDSLVIPLAHRHEISPELFRKMSGGNVTKASGPIVFIGCGSIGSKIAMHLARAGHGPFSLIDRSIFSPHNAARHALTGFTELGSWPKAELLAQEIEQLHQKARFFCGDVLQLLGGQRGPESSLPQDSSLVIDSSGSIVVREKLASLPQDQLPGRLMHVGLYSGGKVGLIAVEGPKRNPNVSDLVVRFWQERAENPALAAQFSISEGELARYEVGQGCGSATIIMSDSRLSIFAAGMAERARQLLENGEPETGELLIGMLNGNELGVDWTLLRLASTIHFRVKARNSWQIRIFGPVANLISAEARSWGRSETGGVLIGRVSLARRCFTISGLIEAPPDSIRSETSFILGVQGLRMKVAKVREDSGETLTYIGTWHSHPRGGDVSSIDRNSLKKIKELRFGAPSLGLIWTPHRFRAEVNEGKLG